MVCNNIDDRTVAHHSEIFGVIGLADWTPVVQQKDCLCGPYCVAAILNTYSRIRPGAQILDEDFIAELSGTVLPRSGEAVRPAGTVSRRDYRLTLPVTDDQYAGTAPRGLMDAIETASQDQVRSLPVRGPWDEQTLDGFIAKALKIHSLQLVANLQTGCLWGSNPSFGIILSQLAGQAYLALSPDWDTGHYCRLVGYLQSAGGGVVIIRDSYPTVGYGGYHFQPIYALTAALKRQDGQEGGLLAVYCPDVEVEVTELVKQYELDTAVWENGSSYRNQRSKV